MKIKNYLKLLIILTFNLAFLTLNLSVANAQTVDFSKYIKNVHTPINSALVPQDLKQKLEDEINRMIADRDNDGQYDYLSPFVVNNRGLRDQNILTEGGYIFDPNDAFKRGRTIMGMEAYFFNPAETIYTLSLVYPYVSSSIKQKIKDYVNLEISRKQPLTYLVGGIDLTFVQGFSRTAYSARNANIWPPYTASLEDVYALWSWANVLSLEGDNSGWNYLSAHWTDINNLYQNNPSSQPNFKVANAAGRVPYYGDIAGLIGIARVASHLNQTAIASDATNLVNNFMQSGLNFDGWRQNLDNDFSKVSSYSVDPAVPIFNWLVPEVGLYMKENIENQPPKPVSTYIDNALNGTNIRWGGGQPIPNWYQAWVERQAGGEVNFLSPQFSQNIFMAKAYILGENQENLKKYISLPWILGDLYYLQKVVAIIEAPSSHILATDINQDGRVDLLDLQVLFENWNVPRDRRADINGDGAVNGVDFTLILKDWGK